MGNENAPSLEIIQAASGHVERIAPLFDAYRMFYGEASDLSTCRQFLAARVKFGDSIVFFATDDERSDDPPLGFTILYPTFDSVLAAPVWILNDIYVAESARRRGVAQALIERARELVEETMAARLSLATGVDNAPSHALYERLGFKRDDSFYTFVLDL